MEISKMNMNEFFNKYEKFINNISSRYNYDTNISQILYIILPAFVIKYGIIHERKILNIFENVEIITTNKYNNHQLASFNRRIIKYDKGYKVEKKIILNKYKQLSLVDLVDSLTHEFNHAINSVNNELKKEDGMLYLRSGLSYTTYSQKDLKTVPTTENIIILEEILNTLQTEEIIKIILTFIDKIDNDKINSIVYLLKETINPKFMSNAYFLETFIVRELAKNITFISMLQKMRFSGYEFNIEKWFDETTGINGSLKKLCNNLKEIERLEKKLLDNKMFKNWNKHKIRIRFKNIQEITYLFSSNCIYK